VPKEGKEQRFIVAPEAELEVMKARQKLAITIGVIALLLLLAGGGVAFLLMQKYQQGFAQLPTVQEKPATGLAQTLETQPQPSTNIAQVPQQQETPSTGLVQAPPPPPTPLPVQQVQQGVPAQSFLEQPRPPQQPQPMPIQQPSIQPQKPTIPPGLLDYLEQLKRIEMQRKREASNYWIALQALEDLVKALQGVASTGDILDAPEYNPQKTLQTYDLHAALYDASAMASSVATASGMPTIASSLRPSPARSHQRNWVAQAKNSPQRHGWRRFGRTDDTKAN